MVRLRVNSSVCTGCMNCETVCALSRTGRQDPSGSAIRVELELFSGRHRHIWCRQCPEAPCSVVCPVSAIRLDFTTGAWELDPSVCISCGSCAEACPYKAVFHSPGAESAVKCNLCRGKPQCAEACTFEAITIERTAN